MFRRAFLLMCLLGVAVCLPLAQPARASSAPVVAIQAGHWRSGELPEEFARLRTSTGSVAGGVREVDLNVDIAHRIAEYLRGWGNQAYVLPSTVPPAYRADAFVAIHSDGNANRNARGFKIATHYRDWNASTTLVRELEDEYAKQTGLPKDWRITDNMRGYYPFNSGLYEHTIAEDTPAAIVEMGFLSNAADRNFLITNRDLVARAIALGIARFLGARPAEGWPALAPMPRGDVVEVLNDHTPLYDGPGKTFKLVDRASRKERYAVVERQGSWAKLFFFSGKERWVEDFQTKQLIVP